MTKLLLMIIFMLYSSGSPTNNTRLMPTNNTRLMEKLEGNQIIETQADIPWKIRKVFRMNKTQVDGNLSDTMITKAPLIVGKTLESLKKRDGNVSYYEHSSSDQPKSQPEEKKFTNKILSTIHLTYKSNVSNHSSQSSKERRYNLTIHRNLTENKAYASKTFKPKSLIGPAFIVDSIINQPKIHDMRHRTPMKTWKVLKNTTTQKTVRAKNASVASLENLKWRVTKLLLIKDDAKRKSMCTSIGRKCLNRLAIDSKYKNSIQSAQRLKAHVRVKKIQVGNSTTEDRITDQYNRVNGAKHINGMEKFKKTLNDVIKGRTRREIKNESDEKNLYSL